jgi:hypothetical protein
MLIIAVQGHQHCTEMCWGIDRSIGISLSGHSTNVQLEPVSQRLDRCEAGIVCLGQVSKP